MKKTFLAVAVLGAVSSFALAESNVTLYGKLDVGPGVSKTKGDSAKVSLDSNNYYGSRWGFRGVEDLGGGNYVGFQLEQGFSPDKGTASSSRAFHRISRLYAKGGRGELGFGRWGALSSGTGPYDMIGSQMRLNNATTSFGETNAWDVIAGNPGRMDNSIAYVSPDFGGLQFKAMYSNKENGSVEDDSAKQWSKNSHYYGIGGTYMSGGFNSVLVLEVRDRKGEVSIIDPKPIYNVNFGIGYDFVMVAPQLGYTWTKQTDVASQHTVGLSSTTPIGAGKFVYGVRYALGKLEGFAKEALAGDTNYGLFTVNLLYDYPLSKRTEVYAYAGWTKGLKLYKEAGRVSNLFNGSTMNVNGYAFQVGLSHSF